MKKTLGGRLRNSHAGGKGEADVLSRKLREAAPHDMCRYCTCRLDAFSGRAEKGREND